MSAIAPSPPPLFDREVYLRRQAAANGPLSEKLREHIAAELTERLAVINRTFGKALLVSFNADRFAKRLLASGKFHKLESMAPIAGDDMALPELGFDCIISLLDLHAINDVPGHLAQIATALKPDGLAILCFFAGDSLRELRDAFLAAEQEVTGGASPRVAPMIDLREAGGLLQRAGLALPVADLDRLPLRYGEALTLMRDIKTLGYSNALADRRRALTPPTLLLRAAAIYAENFADADGRLPATVEMAWAMAWKPHPSQQQPLRPGSAKARLADALSPSEPASKRSG
jgi:SAM-dependent methyltransferase